MQLAFKAIFDGYRTTKDGGAKVTFTIDDTQTKDAIQLIEWKDKVLYVVAMPEKVTEE